MPIVVSEPTSASQSLWVAIRTCSGSALARRHRLQDPDITPALTSTRRTASPDRCRRHRRPGDRRRRGTRWFCTSPAGRSNVAQARRHAPVGREEAFPATGHAGTCQADLVQRTPAGCTSTSTILDRDLALSATVGQCLRASSRLSPSSSRRRAAASSRPRCRRTSRPSATSPARAAPR